jgi:hypothetical protein
MADQLIYSLARKARTKLTQEASKGDLDLQRILAHGNFYDRLITELYSLGYESRRVEYCQHITITDPQLSSDQFSTGTKDNRNSRCSKKSDEAIASDADIALSASHSPDNSESEDSDESGDSDDWESSESSDDSDDSNDSDDSDDSGRSPTQPFRKIGKNKDLVVDMKNISLAQICDLNSTETSIQVTVQELDFGAYHWYVLQLVTLLALLQIQLHLPFLRATYGLNFILIVA